MVGLKIIYVSKRVLCEFRVETELPAIMDLATILGLLYVHISHCCLVTVYGTMDFGHNCCLHYNDVIMSTMTSQITSLAIVYSAVYSGADQRKHQSSASLAFVRGIHRGPANSPHKWPVTRKMFPFDDVIMCRLFGEAMIFIQESTYQKCRLHHGSHFAQVPVSDAKTRECLIFLARGNIYASGSWEIPGLVISDRHLIINETRCMAGFFYTVAFF